MKKNDRQLICSSPTLVGLTALINRFYFSEHWQVEEDLIPKNGKNGQQLPPVVLKKGRYYFYM